MLALRAVHVCALAVALAGAALPALANVAWSGDDARSSVTLSVSRLLMPRVTGTIPFVSATVVTADGAQIPSHVDAVLNAAAMTTHDPGRDAQLRGDRFFDVARFPTIAFASERVVATGPLTFAIQGELTMHGVTHALTLDARLARITHDASGRPRARYEATGRFRRSDFGMVYARGIVSNDVRLDVVLETVGPLAPR